MRHVALTCKNHLDKRWSCKSTAFTPGWGYNGSRNLFFNSVNECSCPPRDLVLAPEDPWSGLSLEEQRKAIELDCK